MPNELANLRRRVIAVAIILALSACDNANLRTQLSDATSEADKHSGVVLYSGFSFQLVRVRIDGVDYIANTRGGLVREEK